jgi:hypothetical protein
MIMKKFGLLFYGSLLVMAMNAQLKIDNATFFIGAGATVTVQGDVTSNVDIQGTGLLQLKGSSLQNVDMSGHTIPNLELDNLSNATLLNTNARIGTSFLFTNGKFQTGNLNMIIGSGATITGHGAAKFFQTNGTGQLMKELTADVAGFELPVGENTNYRPAYLTTAGGSYTSASFGVRVLGTADANKPPMIASFLNTNWPVTKTGIGGTASLSGQYIDPTDVQGTEANLRGYFNNGTDWSSTGETHDGATNRVGAPVTSASGVVSGMNKFIAVGAKAWLQGAYQSPIITTGLMNDNLRTLPFGTASNTANFPQDDPYRQAPYSTTFTHVNNAATEVIPNSGIVAAQGIPGNSIVDWVFIELRNTNASPGNSVLQTRSALIQRDGDIVDVDGVSPVTFNNIADGNYILTIRHRNHLGLSLDQGTPKNFTEAKSLAGNAGKLADLINAPDAELFGTSTAFTTMNIGGPIVKALWGGNANVTAAGAGGIRYAATNSDNNTVLQQVLTFPGNVTGAYNYTGTIGYFSGDCNMNKNVRYVTSSDGAIILTNILSLSAAYNSTALNQQIPN